NYSDALEYYNLGVELAKKYGVADQEAYGYVNLGNLFIYQENFRMAEDNLAKAMNIGKYLNDSAILAYAFLNLGRTRLAMKDFDKSEAFFYKALDIRTQCKRLNNQCNVVRKYLADCHAEAGLTDLARKEYQACLDDLDIVGDYDILTDISIKMSRIYYNEKKYAVAMQHARSSLAYAKQMGSKYATMNAYNMIADILYLQNKYKDAADNYRDQISCNDSIFNEQLTTKLFNIQFSADQNRKQMEIDRMAKDQELMKQIQKAQRTFILALMGGILMVILVLVIIVVNNRKVKRLNAQLQVQKDELSDRNARIEEQQKLLIKQQTQIADSISYAQRIQSVLLPTNEEFASVFSDKFVYYNPRNVVSGDFFWQMDCEDCQVIVVADCTGHGVPGAFMSMLGISALHGIVSNGTHKAGDILNNLRELIKTLLRQNTADDSTPKDGMDIALMVVDRKCQTLEYAGGNIPLIYIRDGQLYDIKPSRNPIGVYRNEIPFEGTTLQLQKGDRIYLSSDGYASQFRQGDKQKIKMSGYKDILLKTCQLPMAEQCQQLSAEFDAWKGSMMQIDDICVAGFLV
ncbi:MAG: SpoIIE family protein phosphatase, partial [Bacteroidales bacterium]|nr:SpoIIE family protein phosphatase [Bacteroidales bacterium]